MCGAGPGTGGWGRGVGVKGGSWNSSQVTAAHILLWVGMWGCGGGAMMGVGRVVGKGVGRGFYWSLNKTGIVTGLGCRNERYDTKSYTKSRGIPDFWENPPVMTSRSWKYVIISPKKSPKMRRREISPHYLCKKEQPSWKTEKLAHFEFLNSNISVFGHDFKPKMEISTDISVIWRWYKRLVIVFSGFWVKIGGNVGPVPMGLEISNNYCGVMDAFRGLKLIICRDIGLIWMSCGCQGCGFSCF